MAFIQQHPHTHTHARTHTHTHTSKEQLEATCNCHQMEYGPCISWACFRDSSWCLMIWSDKIWDIRYKICWNNSNYSFQMNFLCLSFCHVLHNALVPIISGHLFLLLPQNSHRQLDVRTGLITFVRLYKLGTACICIMCQKGMMKSFLIWGFQHEFWQEYAVCTNSEIITTASK